MNQIPRRAGGGSTGAVAVLVDGENTAVGHEATILEVAKGLGTVRVRRVYGDAARLPGWEAAPEFLFIHTRCGKNSADIRLVIDAMELACCDGLRRFVIASSDADFAPLAYRLREIGAYVVGVGEDKASDAFRAACARFQVVGDCQPAPDRTERQIVAIPQKRPDRSGLPICDLNHMMRGHHDVKISALPEKTWREYLTRRGHLFDCDPRGPSARVRLCKGVTV